MRLSNWLSRFAGASSQTTSSDYRRAQEAASRAIALSAGCGRCLTYFISIAKKGLYKIR
jgi:hypothetical protein